MVLTKQAIAITHDILLILTAAFSPDALLYNNIINSFKILIISGVVWARRWVLGKAAAASTDVGRQVTRLSR